MVHSEKNEKERELLIRRNLELSAILEVSRVLTASFDLEENLTSVMTTLSHHLDMQRGCVFLLDPLSKELKIVAAHSLTPEAITRGKYQIGEGIVGRVIKSGSPMFIPNIGKEPRFLNKTESRPDKCGISFLCMPIELKGEILGVITVDRIYAEEHGNVDDDLRVLRIVASVIAQFIKLWELFIKSEKERESLRFQLRERYSLPNIIGESREFQRVIKTVMKVAVTDTTVLLLGESGTGKELIARTLHYQSKRSKGPFVAVNVAALPENLIEAELFGVEKGAYTGATEKRTGRFENAAGGTLFLDEIGELPLTLQAKLLRVLQEKTFERIGSSKSLRTNVRVVAATNKNLQEEVKKGTFRDDLFWRLNVVPIHLPALRQRKGDIPLLVAYYLKKFNKTYNKKTRLAEDTYGILKNYYWPGNVRELANTIERVVIMAEDDYVRPDDLPFEITTEPPEEIEMVDFLAGKGHTLNQEVQSLEYERIIKALKENDYVQHRAARALGITPRQLGYRIKKYGIVLRDI
jgi:Nif-specific regulatory protein